MAIPSLMLAGFAAWTVLLLSCTVGVYRWSLILTGRAPVNAFRADIAEGSDWYRRAMRAHANCVENLPVFAAMVFALHVVGVVGDMVDRLSIGIMVARVLQSCVHVSLPQSSRVATARFIFFAIQLGCFFCLFAILVAAVLFAH